MFLFYSIPCHSLFSGGVICGPIWGLFLVWGSFAALYISQRLCNRVLAILRTYVAFAASYLHIYVLYLSGYLAAIVTLNAKWYISPIEGRLPAKDWLALLFGFLTHSTRRFCKRRHLNEKKSWKNQENYDLHFWIESTFQVYFFRGGSRMF